MGSSASSASSSCNSSTSAFNSTSKTKFNSQFPSTKVQQAFSFPMPSIHHPPVKRGDTHHFVSLTSSTYGSLLLDGASDGQPLPYISILGKKNDKTTSNTEEVRDSLSPDSVINTWELMNGLDDESDTGKRGSDVKLDSFCKPIVSRDIVVNGSALKLDESYGVLEIGDEEDWSPLPFKPKQPLWKHMSEESFLSDLDPNIISSYRRALSSRKLRKNSSNGHTNTNSSSHSNQTTLADSVSSSSLSSQAVGDQEKPILLETEENKNKIVLYFTSLRGIRKTYEDCCSVRSILRGFQVIVEERDISMDSKYRKELQIALGEEKPVCLPQVFIRGIRIGGIDEIKLLNDGGELGDMLKGFPTCESVGVCDSCGDARFVPCTNCGGSTKFFEDGFKRCNGCNENGLVRCNICCIF